MFFFFIYIKTSASLSAKYYWENKERQKRKAREGYQNLSKEKKKQQYGHERNKNVSEYKKINEKNKRVEHRKKYYRMRTSTLL